MSIKLELPNITELKPRISVIGVGGAGGNAINNMIASGIDGVEFMVCNTDAQALAMSSAETVIQLGQNLTEGLGAGANPDIGEGAAEEALDEVRSHLSGSHMVFVAAGMGGGTGTGAAPVIARAAHDLGVLTVGVVTKPFHFEGNRRMRIAEGGIEELAKHVDTLIVIPNQNLFRIATEKTTFSEAFLMADQVLHAGIACITDLIVREGLINLDFADVKAVMLNMGTAMMGTGEATGERRALEAAEAAISNPLLDEISMKGAKGLLISILGSQQMTLYEVDEAASRVREEVDAEANIIVGASFDEAMGDKVRVSIVASGLPSVMGEKPLEGPGSSLGVTINRRPDTTTIPTPPVRDRQPSPPTSRVNESAPAPKSPTFVDAADDVTIELGPPTLLSAGVSQKMPQSNGPAPTESDSERQEFRAAPPADVPSNGPTRVPGLDAFPEIAKRAFQAKAEGQPQTTPVQQKRATLFERLTGKSNESNWLDDDESPATVAPGQAPASHAPNGSENTRSERNSRFERATDHETGSSENADMSSFFGRDGGRRNSG